MTSLTLFFVFYHLIKKIAQLKTNKLYIFLFTSKPKFFRKKLVFIMIASHDETCLLILFCNLFKNLFLFSTFSLTHQINQFFIRKYLVAKINSGIKTLKLNNKFNGHLFKKNATITINQQGFWENKIQLLNCWKFYTYK